MNADATSINSAASQFLASKNEANIEKSNLTNYNYQLYNLIYAKDADITSLQTKIDQLKQHITHITTAIYSKWNPSEKPNITTQPFVPTSPTNPPRPPLITTTHIYQREQKQHPQDPCGQWQKQRGSRVRGNVQRLRARGHSSN